MLRYNCDHAGAVLDPGACFDKDTAEVLPLLVHLYPSALLRSVYSVLGTVLNGMIPV